MSCYRAVLVSALVSMSCLWAGAFAEDTPLNETLIDLVQNKHDYTVTWSTMFKGEYSPPAWISSLEATSTPARQTNINGKDYVFASMCKADDCAGDRILVLFSSDHKKCWALEMTVPAGLGKDSVAHPKKYAAFRYYGAPDQSMKNNLLAQLDIELGPEKPEIATPEPVTPAPGPESKPTPAATKPAVPFTPQDDEKARKFRADMHAKKGAELIKQNNFRQAESEYKEAAKYAPDNIQYLEGYAEATHKANDCKESIEAYGRLLKADAAHHPEAHALIADSLFKLRRYDESVDEYKKAVGFEKNKAEIWHKIAEIRIGQAKHPEAMEAYRNAIKAAPGDGKAYKLLATMQWNGGSKAEALKTYRDGTQSAPRDGDLQAAYAYALMSNQQWQEAANAYKAAAMAKGTNSEIEAGYKSAMDHIAYDEEMAKRAAAAEKKKKKHKN